MTTKTRAGWLGVGIASLGLIGAPAALARPAHQPDRAAEPPPVLLIDRAGLDRWVVDERDAGLARAIEMLPARLRELPQELPDLRELSPAALDLIITIASRPGRIALTYNPHDQTGGGFGLGLVAGFEARDREHAAALQGTVGALLAQGGAPFQMTPSEQFSSMSETFLPFGLLRYGPRQGEGERWRWEVHFGSIGDPDQAFAALPPAAAVGEGFSPVARASFDPAPLSPLINMLRMFAAGQPEAQQGIQRLIETGLIGPDAMSYDFQAGFLPDRSITRTTIRNARKYAPNLGLSTKPLADNILAAIPSDATVAVAARFDISQIVAELRGGLEQDPEIARGLARFHDQTGVDLIDDLVASLGDTAGLYLSDTTGGAKIGSAVAFMTLSDPAKFRTANARLTAALNVFLAENPDLQGRIRGRQWAEGESTLYSLTFAGLPVPFELTYAVTDGMVVLGLTPQATLAAVRQINGGGDRGLTANEAFRGAMPRDRQVTSVLFIDSARTMRSGYQYVSFIGSAIANTVRSPLDPGREPGLVVPPFSELRRGVRARVSYSYWDGDNLVRVTEGNRSVLAETAGVLGAAEPLFPAVGAVLGGVGSYFQVQEQGRGRGRW